ncbi:MAG: hypothetical protein NC517_11875 [Firmicutes bacterium]|nr:hypothetical protein [Bacillota bacterium]
MGNRVFRTVEFANGMDADPTAIQIELALLPMQSMLSERSILIGNLKTEAVKDILQKLLTLGYFDLSSLEYQKEMSIEETVFDEGASKPYTTDFTYGVGCVQSDAGAFGWTPVPQNDIFSNYRMCDGCDGRNTESWGESEDEDDEE